MAPAEGGVKPLSGTVQSSVGRSQASGVGKVNAVNRRVEDVRQNLRDQSGNRKLTAAP